MDDGKRLLAGGADGFVRCWDLDAGRWLYQFRGHDFTIDKLTPSRDGRLVAIGGPQLAGFLEGGIGEVFREEGAVVKVLETATGRMLDRVVVGLRRPGLAFTPPGDRWLILTRGGLAIRDVGGELKDERPTRVLAVGGEDDWCCGGKTAISADAKRAVATCGQSGPGEASQALRLWDIRTGRIRTLEWFEDQVGRAITHIAISAGGERVAVKSFGIAGAADLERALEDQDAMARLENDQRVPEAQGDQTRRALVTVLDFETGNVVSQLRMSREVPESVGFLALSPEGEHVVTANIPTLTPRQGPVVGVWDARMGRLERVIQGPGGDVRCVVFLPGGRMRIVSSNTVDLEKRGGDRDGERLVIWECGLTSP